MTDVALVIPVLNEEAVLPTLFETLTTLDPAPSDIVFVDGGSTDKTCDLINESSHRLLNCSAGRSIQINAGVDAAQATNVCVLHADTMPPADMIKVISNTLADPAIALASFTPLIRGPEKIRWGTTFHNYIKTWYGPLLSRPHLFFRGVRLLFGDHAMFFRRAQYLQVGGCDPDTEVMEEADLCVRLATLGKVILVPRWIETSDRRIAEWGALKANWIYLKVAIKWTFGSRPKLADDYPDVR